MGTPVAIAITIRDSTGVGQAGPIPDKMRGGNIEEAAVSATKNEGRFKGEETRTGNMRGEGPGRAR